jgi:hypothetical protein
MSTSICADSGALACTKSGESPVVRKAYRVPRAWGSELNRQRVQFRIEVQTNYENTLPARWLRGHTSGTRLARGCGHRINQEMSVEDKVLVYWWQPLAWAIACAVCALMGFAAGMLTR